VGGDARHPVYGRYLDPETETWQTADAYLSRERLGKARRNGLCRASLRKKRLSPAMDIRRRSARSWSAAMVDGSPPPAPTGRRAYGPRWTIADILGAKLRASERGWRYVLALFVKFGAAPPQNGQRLAGQGEGGRPFPPLGAGVVEVMKVEGDRPHAGPVFAGKRVSAQRRPGPVSWAGEWKRAGECGWVSVPSSPEGW